MCDLDESVGNKEKDELSEEDLVFAYDIVKFVLTMDYSKKPIKQADILGSLPFKPKRKRLNLIMDEAQDNLKKLGMSLVEVQNTSTKSYLLVQGFEAMPSVFEYLPKEEKADRTLLVLVLSFIFMKEGVVDEDEIWHFLDQLKITTEKKPVHDYFGDSKKKITGQFVEQCYLSYKKEGNTEQKKLRWGQRADLEVSKKTILEFVCKCGFGDKVKPENWVSQYQQVKGNDEPEKIAASSQKKT